MSKTNAARQLDRLGIGYQTLHYSVSKEDFSAIRVAEEVGMPPAHVFKTLLVAGDNAPCLAVVPGDRDLDLKAVARAREQKKAALVPLTDVKAWTGYERGSVTALAVKKTLDVYLDESAVTLQQMAVSGGAYGVQLVLDPGDYVRATNATVAPLT